MSRYERQLKDLASEMGLTRKDARGIYYRMVAVFCEGAGRSQLEKMWDWRWYDDADGYLSKILQDPKSTRDDLAYALVLITRTYF